jgi:hypothetical protein
MLVVGGILSGIFTVGAERDWERIARAAIVDTTTAIVLIYAGAMLPAYWRPETRP